MFTVQEFFTEKGTKALLADKVYRYETRAVAFFRSQFPQKTKYLSEEQLHDVVKLAYKNSKSRDLNSERDHWKYLVIVGFWGSYFEQDLQYQNILKNLGWDDPYCNDLDGLIDQISSFQNMKKLDVNKKESNFRKLVEILLNPNLKITRDFGIQVIYAIWPNWSRQFSSDEISSFVSASAKITKDLNIGDKSRLIYTILSVNFGSNFLNDPLYPWTEKIKNLDGDEQEPLIAFLKEASYHWDE